MVRIFQIGFHISGTRSLAKFFETNGFKSFHHSTGRRSILADQLFENLKDGKTHFNKNFEGPFPGAKGVFYSDMENNMGAADPRDKREAYKLFKELDLSYPGSLFILNTRDDWVDRKIRGLKTEDARRTHRATGWSKEDIREWLRKDQKEHYKKVREYFKGRKEFIEFNIKKDNIQKIIDWLNEFDIEIKNKRLTKIRG